MPHNIYAQRVMLLPWDCTFNPQDQTLIGSGTGTGEEDIPYQYTGLGEAGDYIWLNAYAAGQRISGPGVDPKGFDNRFNGLYIVEDHGDNDHARNWKIRRAPSLDTTEKYQETKTVWILSDANNTIPSWSPLGKPFQVYLPLFFQLNVSVGPLLYYVDPTASPPGQPS